MLRSRLRWGSEIRNSSMGSVIFDAAVICVGSRPFARQSSSMLQSCALGVEAKPVSVEYKHLAEFSRLRCCSQVCWKLELKICPLSSSISLNAVILDAAVSSGIWLSPVIFDAAVAFAGS